MKFKDTIDDDKFYEMVFKKGKSLDSLGVAKATVTNLGLFCRDAFGDDTNAVLTQLKKEESSAKILNFLNDFIDWLNEDHPDVLWKRTPTQKKATPVKAKSIKTIRDYMSFAKKYLK